MSTNTRTFGTIAVVGSVALGGLFGCSEVDDEHRDVTWGEVHQILVDHGCADGSCHSADSAEAELDLSDMGSHGALVDEPCSNPSAEENGLIRVWPGERGASFLIHKLELRAVDDRFGMPMPPIGDPLDAEEIELVAAWIDAGAPTQ